MILTLLFIALLGASYTNIPSLGNPTPNTFNETIKPKKIAYNVDSVIDETITQKTNYVLNKEDTMTIPSPMQGPITLYTRERNNITKYQVAKNENYYTLVDTTYLIYQTQWRFTDSARTTLISNGVSFMFRFVNIKKITPFSTNATLTMNGDLTISNTLYDANNNPIGFDRTEMGIENGNDYYAHQYYTMDSDEYGANIEYLLRQNTYETIYNAISDTEIYNNYPDYQLGDKKILLNIQEQQWKIDIDTPSSIIDGTYYQVTDTGLQASGNPNLPYYYDTQIGLVDPYVIVNEEKLYFQDMTNENYWDSLQRTSGGTITYNYDLLSQGNVNTYQDWHIVVDTHGQTGTEVIDIPGLMWQILIMPFSFISQAFNVTIFEGTPYQLNFANLFKGLIAIMTLLFVIRLFTGGINMLGEYSTQIEGASAKREQRKRDRKLYKDSKNGVVEKDVE